MNMQHTANQPANQRNAHAKACEENLCKTLSEMEERLGTVEAYNLMQRYSDVFRARLVKNHHVRDSVAA